MIEKENIFKAIEKVKMKSIFGGSGGAWCRATAKCSDGTSVTITCENAQSGCVATDAGSPGYSGNGSAYCTENGVIQFALCPNKATSFVAAS